MDTNKKLAAVREIRDLIDRARILVTQIENRIEADERLNGLATNLREELLSAAALVDVLDGEVR